MFKAQGTTAGKLISFSRAHYEKTPPEIYEFQCLSLWVLHCKKKHILKELCGRGHWCVPPSIHLFCSAGSRQVIQYIWVITADVKAELTAFVYYISHQILLFSSTSRIISGGGLPWQYPAPLPACTRKNSPSTAEILRGKPAAGFKLLALHNTAK